MLAISLRPPTNLHQIFQEDGKWAAIEKLSFWFLNSFRGVREVQKGHFHFEASFTKCSMHDLKVDLLIEEKKEVRFWPDNFSNKC